MPFTPSCTWARVQGRSFGLWSAAMPRQLAATVCATLLALVTSLRAEPSAPLAAFQMLIGEWKALDDPSGATGGFTFAFGVQDRVIIRTNYSNSPAADGQPASRHDDLMVIYVEGGFVRADYFDNEGHVIRYVAEARSNEIVLLSEVKASEPRYRLSYRRGSDGILNGRFDVAPPGKPEAFSSYLSWSARKRP
jgi:hypothetical protein